MINFNIDNAVKRLSDANIFIGDIEKNKIDKAYLHCDFSGATSHYLIENHLPEITEGMISWCRINRIDEVSIKTNLFRSLIDETLSSEVRKLEILGYFLNFKFVGDLGEKAIKYAGFFIEIFSELDDEMKLKILVKKANGEIMEVEGVAFSSLLIQSNYYYDGQEICDYAYYLESNKAQSYKQAFIVLNSNQFSDKLFFIKEIIIDNISTNKLSNLEYKLLTRLGLSLETEESYEDFFSLCNRAESAFEKGRLKLLLRGFLKVLGNVH